MHVSRGRQFPVVMAALAYDLNMNFIYSSQNGQAKSWQFWVLVPALAIRRRVCVAAKGGRGIDAELEIRQI